MNGHTPRGDEHPGGPPATPRFSSSPRSSSSRSQSPWRRQLRLARVQLLAVMRKEVLQTLRDRRMMALLVVAPFLQTVALGYAVDFDVDRVPTLVVDQDNSAASREHTRRFLADGTLERRRSPAALSTTSAERALESGEASAVVIIPQEFGAKLASGETAFVQVLLDGSDPNRGTVAGGATTRYFGEVGTALARERLQASGRAAPPGIVLVPRVAYNPSLRTPPYMIPGVMAMLLLIVTTIVTAMGLSREREMGTLEQVMVTPIRPSLLLIGKLVPYMITGCFDVLLVLCAGMWLFAVPVRGSLALAALASIVYLMAMLGVGLFISTMSKTQQQSFLGGFLFALPAILLSGVMTPVRGMPAWLQAVTYLNPVRYYVEIMRGCLLRGAGLADLWPWLVLLLAFGVTLLAVASLRFQKRAG